MRNSLALFPLALLLPGALAWGGATNDTITTSTSSSQFIHTTNNAADVNTYRTRLTARIGNGSLLYDQTFNVQLSDATVQAAIQQARNQLTNAGAVSIAGPTQQSNLRTLTGTSQTTVEDSRTATETITLEDTVGPGTIIIGDRDRGGTAFQVLVGTANLNINTHTQTDIFQTVTTTSTYQVAQTYELKGLAQPAPPPTPTPAPPSFWLALTGLAAAGYSSYKKKRRKPECPESP